MLYTLSFLVILAFICLACVVNTSVFADNIDDGSILSGKPDSVPIIGEVNAGIGATIDVSAIKAAQEEEKETPPPPPVLTLDDFKKKSVKQLKEYLKDRGLECKGCSEKADFVKLAYDHRETPVTTTQTPSEEKKSGISDVPDGEKLDQAKIDELLANLKRSGFGNNRFFNADDLRDLNPEELNAKFNDPNYKPKSSSTKNSKKSSDKSKKTGAKKESGSSSGSSSSKSKAKNESKPKSQKKKADPKPSKTSPSTPVHDQEEETIEL